MQGASLIPHHYYGFDYSLMPSSSDIEEVAASNIINMLPLLSYDSPVSVMMNNSDHRMLLPHHMSEIDTAAAYINQNINHVFEPGEVYINPMPQNWAIQGGKVAARVEEGDDQVKVVGRYSVEERKDRILRYLKKRSRRNFNKTIKYACRKTLADKRVRVRGRFAKNSEAEAEAEAEGEEDEEEEEEFCNYQHSMDVAMACTSFHDQDDQFSSSSSFQMIKYDEDDWFQAAIDNIGNLPYL